MSIFVATDETIRDAVKRREQYPPIGEWDTSNVTDMSSLFSGSNINEPLNNWDVSNVVDMRDMFSSATRFNQPLNNWNVSKVERMTGMFYNAEWFNQELSNWDVSYVQDMGYMFMDAIRFNQPINNWNVSDVEYMNHMFDNARSFNQPLNNWNVSNVNDMNSMFRQAHAFNQPLNNWDVSIVADMGYMFNNARSFRQDISNWNLASIDVHDEAEVNSYANMFYNTRMPPRFKPPVILEVDDAPDPLAQQQPRGQAYEVHNAFHSIQFRELFTLMTNGNVDSYAGTMPFNEYVVHEMQQFADNYSGENKEGLNSKLNSLKPKMRSIDYAKETNAFYTILQFVKKQEKQYQDNYVYFFTNECYNAYNTGTDTTSCVKGIKERLLISLGQAGYNIDNPLYKKMAEIVFPIKDEHIYLFVNKCIEANREELIKISNKYENNDEKSNEEKKSIIKECVKERIRQSHPNANVDTMDERLHGMLKNAEDMFTFDSLSGGRRKRSKTKKKRHRHSNQTMSKKVKQYKKDIKLKKKSKKKSKKKKL